MESTVVTAKETSQPNQARLARQVAITFDGSNANALLKRMNPADGATATRCLGPGAIAFSGSATPLGDGSVSVITGVPLGKSSRLAPASSEEAIQAFCALDGAFNAFHWDAADETLVVVSDVLGKAPLYWRRSAKGIALFTETKAVTGDPHLGCWGAFLSFGHCIGGGTLVDGVERFPPATVLRFRPRDGKLTLNRYWHWPDISPRVRTDDLIDALTANIQQYHATCPHHTLFLSGGCDSRLILYLMQRGGIEARARIVVHDDEFGDADGRCAVAAARSAGIPYEVCRPSADFFSSKDFLEYVVAIDASAPSLGLFIAKLQSHIPDTGFWDGLMLGGLLRDFDNPGTFKAYEANAIAGWEHPNWRAARLLFGEETAHAMHSAFHHALAEVRADYADNADDVARFTVEQRGLNRTSQNPLKAFARRGTPLIPGLHRDVLAVAANIPYAARRGSRMYLDMLRRINPRALRAPLITGGRPLRRSALDFQARRMEWRAAIDQSILRHPRLAQRLRVTPSPIPIPAFTRDCLEADADPWINCQPLRAADPTSWDGFVLWRLYFHWSAWRALHAGENNAGMLVRQTPDHSEQPAELARFRRQVSQRLLN